MLAPSGVSTINGLVGAPKISRDRLSGICLKFLSLNMCSLIKDKSFLSFMFSIFSDCYFVLMDLMSTYCILSTLFFLVSNEISESFPRSTMKIFIWFSVLQCSCRTFPDSHLPISSELGWSRIPSWHLCYLELHVFELLRIKGCIVLRINVLRR